MEALVAGSPTIRFVNDVYSMRVLLERLTPTQDQAHTLPRRPSMPLLLSGEPPDEDLVLEWKKEHFGEEEAEEAHAEQKALRDALQAEEASLEAQKRAGCGDLSKSKASRGTIITARISTKGGGRSEVVKEVQERTHDLGTRHEATA